MEITVNGGKLSQKEINTYIMQIKEANPDKEFKTFNFTVDGEYVDVNYTYEAVPFERIRRITGYLVGTLDRFNNAKRSEVEDRVKHGLNTSCCSLEDIA
ncbi:MAG: anaerobic ribonucleoside-triphosphate reductase [Ruminococcus sp.]